MRFSLSWLRWRTRTYLVAGILVIVVLLIVSLVRGNGTDTTIATATVRPIARTVTASGQTTAETELALGFERGGRVSASPYAVGDEVAAGTVLARLDPGTLAADRLRAEADLAALDRGATPEAVRVAEAETAAARTKHENARRAFGVAARSTYLQVDTLVHNVVDKMFNTSGGYEFVIEFTSGDAVARLTASEYTERRALAVGRRTLETDLKDWGTLIASNDIDTMLAAEAAQTSRFDRTLQFFRTLALAVSKIAPDDRTSQTVIESYQAELAGANTTLANAIETYSAAYESVQSTTADLETSERQLTETKAPATTEDRQRALAALAAVDAELRQTMITAPIAGRVTRQDAKVGESVTAGTPLIGLMSTTGFLIEANVPEVEIAGIAVGRPVTIVFDAFPRQEFLGRVSTIDPAETDVDGVVNYRVKIALDTAVSNLRSGMTATVHIEVDRRDRALTIPAAAVRGEGTKTLVTRLDGSTPRDVPVTVGLQSDEGLVEIISGLAPNDRVVVSTP